VAWNNSYSKRTNGSGFPEQEVVSQLYGWLAQPHRKAELNQAGHIGLYSTELETKFVLALL
jgi:hypothetical protein